jgi:hypothetical protein
VRISFKFLKFSKSVDYNFFICFLDLPSEDILVQQSIHFVEVEHDIKLHSEGKKVVKISAKSC